MAVLVLADHKDGGITQPPAGFDPTKGYVNPFAADKPLFTSDASNVEQHKDKLAPGDTLAGRNALFLSSLYETNAQ